MGDISLFTSHSGDLPAHLKTGELDPVTKALMGGGTTGRRLSIRGSVFRMVVDGKEVAQSEDRHMNIVIVAANPHISRSYYEGEYTEGSTASPDCQSADGITPDAKSPNKQSEKCASCPQNIANSGPRGGRACRYSQQLAVVLEHDQTEGSVYQLSLPAQSIFGSAENGKMPLQAYARFLGGHGLPVTSVVTEMRFDINSSTPKLFFRAVRPLTAKEMDNAKAIGASDAAKMAIAFSAAPANNAAAAPAPAPAPVQAPKASKAKPAEAEPVEEPKVRQSKPAMRDVETILGEWAEK